MPKGYGGRHHRDFEDEEDMQMAHMFGGGGHGRGRRAH